MPEIPSPINTIVTGSGTSGLSGEIGGLSAKLILSRNMASKMAGSQGSDLALLWPLWLKKVQF